MLFRPFFRWNRSVEKLLFPVQNNCAVILLVTSRTSKFDTFEQFLPTILMKDNSVENWFNGFKQSNSSTAFGFWTNEAGALWSGRWDVPSPPMRITLRLFGCNAIEGLTSKTCVWRIQPRAKNAGNKAKTLFCSTKDRIYLRRHSVHWTWVSSERVSWSGFWLALWSELWKRKREIKEVSYDPSSVFRCCLKIWDEEKEWVFQSEIF